MDARTELIAYMGAALITIAGLFTLQQWYASYLDVNVVHASRADVPRNAKVAATREQEHQKLASGAMPIADAKRALAQRSRSSFPRIAPKPSDDLTPMSGWIHRQGFAGYAPRSVTAPGANAPAPDVEGASAPGPGNEGGAAERPASAEQPAVQPAGGKQQ